MSEPAPTPPPTPSPIPSPAIPLREPAQRPTSVTVIAILGIILGAFGFLCLPLSLVFYFVQLPAAPGQASNPASIVLDTVKNDSLLFGFTMATTVMNWVLSALVLAASIGALGLKQWARQMMIGWGITALLLCVVQTIFHFAVYLPKMREMAAQNPGNPVAVAAGSAGWIGIAVGLLLGMGIPITVLIVMNRANVKDAFNRGLKPIM